MSNSAGMLVCWRSARSRPAKGSGQALAEGNYFYRQFTDVGAAERDTAERQPLPPPSDSQQNDWIQAGGRPSPPIYEAECRGWVGQMSL